MIKWTFIKDIPNNQFRHIVLANNEGKPVTNSRDTQEVMFEQVATHARTHAHARTQAQDTFLVSLLSLSRHPCAGQGDAAPLPRLQD